MIIEVTAEAIERKWDQGGRLGTTFQDPPKVQKTQTFVLVYISTQ